MLRSLNMATLALFLLACLCATDATAAPRSNFGKLKREDRQRNLGPIKQGKLAEDRPKRFQQRNAQSMNRQGRIGRDNQNFSRRAPRPAMTAQDADRRLNRTLKAYSKDVSYAETMVSGKKAKSERSSRSENGTEKRVRNMVNKSMKQTGKKIGLQDFASGKQVDRQLKRGGFVKEKDPLGSFKML